MSKALQAELESALDAVIGDMRTAVHELTDALAAERAALEQADVEALHQASTAKQTHTELLEKLDGERLHLLRAVAYPAYAERADWDDVVNGLAQCQMANQYNGQIVGQRLRQVRQALSVLTGTEAAGVYGPKGSVDSQHRSQSLAEA
ncbi:MULTISPECIES: flagellar export chaperone FlgN [Dyella]|uniref:Flagellar protein FlgN n=2 Tax=Dyella TaxID=231454 RepID=A0A4V2NL70_9GAMM|nr:MULTISPECIES: flagellar export chaperone FlgN [Dyella]TBR37176.1 flagellar protein FlgN [Dyella terrae]TCI07734.1 flagellar protein FlgN [Dyella soli]